jgi:hypothetical protein
MKETAVEWLFNELELSQEYEYVKEILEQAKEMEKEQIKNAFNYGQFDLGMEADEYYKQILKSEEDEDV